MKCVIYRVGRTDGTYVYLREGLGLDALPPELQRRASRMEPVMTLDLDPQRRLARVDVRTVIDRLAEYGWYVQMPPNGAIDVQLHFGD